jgi:hypothetical protein
MMVSAPFMRPDAPRPDTALPTINMVDEVATPQRREPNSNNAKKDRKVRCYSGASVIDFS